LGSTLLESHRTELIRRRDWLRSSWLWYLAQSTHSGCGNPAREVR
jgi:hypothetical protein